MKALIDLSVVYKQDRSVQDRFFFSAPFKLVSMNEEGNDTLQLMLMNVSPGILDGDNYNLQVEVEKEASLQLHTQAYQRLFTMTGSAQQQFIIKIGPNACFTFLPHPTVPHKESNFSSQTEIHMHSSGSLNYGEVITCGRKHSGECFEYTKFHSLTKIYSDQKLILKDNLLFEPSRMNLNNIGQLEGFTHTATYIHISPNLSLDFQTDQLYEWMMGRTEIEFGISRFHERGIIIRMLGNKSELLYECILGISVQLEVGILKPNETEYAC